MTETHHATDSPEPVCPALADAPAPAASPPSGGGWRRPAAVAFMASLLAATAGVVLGSALGGDGGSRGPRTVSFAAATAAADPGADPGAGPTAGPGGGPCRPGRGGFHHRGGAGGTVASVDGKRITVTEGDGAKIVAVVSDATSYRRVAKGSTADLVVGQDIRAGGTTGPDGSVLARLIVVGPKDALPEPMSKFGPPRPDGRAPRVTKVLGTITALDGSNLTVTDAAGQTHKVTATAATRISKVTKAGLGDVTPGARVGIRGTRQADGTVAAEGVTLLPAGLDGPAPMGSTPTS